jgi:hypothetical protein
MWEARGSKSFRNNIETRRQEVKIFGYKFDQLKQIIEKVTYDHQQILQAIKNLEEMLKGFGHKVR